MVDTFCLVVPPKRVPGGGSYMYRPGTDHGPIHQDPPLREPMIRPDELRVLVLEPSWGEDEVRCRLLNVAQSWRTIYEALSYTWGDESVRETIVLDGLRTSVTKNLHGALVHLRKPDRERLLWVDALCINQDDTEERNEQVQKMGSIYWNARRVIGWLGEQSPEAQGDAEDESVVLDLLRRSWFQRTWIIQEAILGHKLFLAHGNGIVPWDHISGSPALKAESVLDSPEWIRALSAVDLIKKGRHECHTKKIIVGRTPKRRARWKKYRPEFKLVNAMFLTRGFQCKDPRDKVFGLLSVVTDVGPEDDSLRPNYRASVEETYETVARWDIEKNRSLDVLSYCSRAEGKRPDLASWAPDFTDMDDVTPILGGQGRARTKKEKVQPGFTWSLIQKAMSKIRAPPEPNPGFENGHGPSFFRENDKTVLVLSGRVVDTIAKVGDVAESPKLPQDIGELEMCTVSQQQTWLRDCALIAAFNDSAPGSDTGGDENGRPPISWVLPGSFWMPRNRKDAFWRSGTLDMSPSRYDDFSKAMLCYTGNVNEYAKFLFGFDSESSSGDVDAEVHRYQKWHKHWHGFLAEIIHGRRFCVGQKGIMGWVPNAAEEGDVMCLISGARVPMILRRIRRAGEEGGVKENEEEGGQEEELGHEHEHEARYMVVGEAHLPRHMPWNRDRSGYYCGGVKLALV